MTAKSFFMGYDLPEGVVEESEKFIPLTDDEKRSLLDKWRSDNRLMAFQPYGTALLLSAGLSAVYYIHKYPNKVHLTYALPQLTVVGLGVLVGLWNTGNYLTRRNQIKNIKNLVTLWMRFEQTDMLASEQEFETIKQLLKYRASSPVRENRIAVVLAAAEAVQRQFPKISEEERNKMVERMVQRAGIDIKKILQHFGASQQLSQILFLNQRRPVVSLTNKDDFKSLHVSAGDISLNIDKENGAYYAIDFNAALKGGIEELETGKKQLPVGVSRYKGFNIKVKKDGSLEISLPVYKRWDPLNLYESVAVFVNRADAAMTAKEMAQNIVKIVTMNADFEKNKARFRKIPLPSRRSVVKGLIALDKAALANEPYNGGIDFNQINVKRNGKTVNVQFDPAQLSALEQGGFEGFTPVITGFAYIASPFALLGIKSVRP